MLVLGEIRGAILIVETNFQCFCLKCKKKTGITKEVYKAKNTKVIIEKGNCRECGTKNRSFRKFTAFSSENYKRHRYFGLYSTKRYSKMRWSELMVPTTDLTPDYIRKAKHRCSPPAHNRGIRPKTKQSNWSGWLGGVAHSQRSKPMPPRSRPGGPYIEDPLRYRPGRNIAPPMQQQPYGYHEQSQAYTQYIQGVASMSNLTRAVETACSNCGRVPPRLQHPAVSCECESQ